MKYLGITGIILAVAIFTIAIDAAKLPRVNPNKRRGGGAGREGRVVKRLRKGRQGRQFFGSRVPVLPFPAPILPPAPFPVSPIFGPPIAPVAQQLRLIEVQPVAPRVPHVLVTQKVVDAVPPTTTYGASYIAPLPTPIPAPLPVPVNSIVEVRNEPAASLYTVPRTAPSLYTVPRTAASDRVAVVASGPPIAITRSVYNAPGQQPGVDDWNYAFETENGIKQEAVGEMKDIGGSTVMVMRGSYEYIGSDSLTYVVTWVADENGFRASAPHLPKSVAIPFPEQQAAVDAQIRFAAEEDRLRAAASGPVPTYGAPEPAATIVEVRAPIAEYGLPTYGAY